MLVFKSGVYEDIVLMAIDKRIIRDEDRMQECVEIENEQSSDSVSPSDDELHLQAHKYLWESYHLVFQTLPSIMAQIIEQGIWERRSSAYRNFGEYALHQSPDGLRVSNNNMLWLLKLAMDAEGKHAPEWGDVLNEVDGSVRTYAKENKVAMKDLSRTLNGAEVNHTEPGLEEAITYLPSRSKSNDGQLLKLRSQDQETYKEVVSGKIKLKEALPSTPRKQVVPIESVKNKFNNLSLADRLEFLAWVEQQGKELIQD